METIEYFETFLDHGEIVLSLRDFGREILEADL
jgi:hypothetical protein